MSASPQVEVKVVYGGSSRRRRPRWSHSQTASPSRRLVALGLLNLLIAGGLCYGTWWWADPDLRIMLIMHTEIGGVDAGVITDQLIPEKVGVPATGAAAAPVSVEGATTRGKLFVASILGWEAVSTFSILAMAVSGGSLLRRSGGSRLRWGVAILLVVAICVMSWRIQFLWGKYEHFVPGLLRLAVGVAVAFSTLVALQIGRLARVSTYFAAMLLILAAAGTAWGLYFGSHSDAISPNYATTGFIAFAFAVHSIWGWVLLPVAYRLPR